MPMHDDDMPEELDYATAVDQITEAAKKLQSISGLSGSDAAQIAAQLWFDMHLAEDKKEFE